MITLASLIILGVIACILCNGYLKNREKRMNTEGFRRYYNDMRRKEKDYKTLMKELNRKDDKR